MPLCLLLETLAVSAALWKWLRYVKCVALSPTHLAEKVQDKICKDRGWVFIGSRDRCGSLCKAGKRDIIKFAQMMMSGTIWLHTCWSSCFNTHVTWEHQSYCYNSDHMQGAAFCKATCETHLVFTRYQKSAEKAFHLPTRAAPKLLHHLVLQSRQMGLFGPLIIL